MKYLAAEDLASVIGKNPLRQYPHPKRDRSRLLPFARPEAMVRARIPDGARFFVLGNCFARSIEKALHKAGQTVLSSRFNPDLPGDAAEQFRRFNIFNLDICTNEIAWATGVDSDMDRAQIEVGEQLVDMQLHFTIAFPPEEARSFRAGYNASYASVSDADVVIAITGGMRQWFDKQAGIYINAMPTRRMIQLYPGRFLLHTMEVEDACASMQRFIDVLRQTNPNALVLIAASPVYQPASFSAEDTLVDQLLGKSIQRAALAKICAENDNVEYLPALDTAILSDFRFGYLGHNFHHTSPNLGYRVVADMLRQRMNPSKGQRIVEALGYGEALSIAEDYSGVVNLLKPMVLNDRGEFGELGPESVAVHRLYALSLLRTGQRSEALAHVIKVLRARLENKDLARDDSYDEITSDQLITTPGNDPLKQLFNLGADLCRMFGTIEERKLLKEFANANQYELERLDDTAMMAKGARPEIKDLIESAEAGEFQKVWLGIAPMDTIRDKLTDKERRRVDQLAMQASIKLGKGSLGIQRVLDLIKGVAQPSPDLILQIVNNSRAHGTIAQLLDAIALGRAAKIEEARLENLEQRLEFLQNKAAVAQPRSAST